MLKAQLPVLATKNIYIYIYIPLTSSTNSELHFYHTFHDYKCGTYTSCCHTVVCLWRLMAFVATWFFFPAHFSATQLNLRICPTSTAANFSLFYHFFHSFFVYLFRCHFTACHISLAASWVICVATVYLHRLLFAARIGEYVYICVCLCAQLLSRSNHHQVCTVISTSPLSHYRSTINSSICRKAATALQRGTTCWYMHTSM